MGFFEEKSIGLHIRDSIIELVLLEKKDAVKVKAFASLDLEEGILDRGRILDEEKLQKALDDLFKEAKIAKKDRENIVFALPSSLTYTHIFSLENGERRNLEQKISEEIHSVIPEEKSALYYEYKVIPKEKKTH